MPPNKLFKKWMEFILMINKYRLEWHKKIHPSLTFIQNPFSKIHLNKIGINLIKNHGMRIISQINRKLTIKADNIEIMIIKNLIMIIVRINMNKNKFFVQMLMMKDLCRLL